MTAAQVNCNSPLCGGSPVSRQRKPGGLLQPARTLITYHPSCKFFSPISDSQGRKLRRRLRIASLRGVRQHISGLRPSIPNITNRESVSLPCYPSPDIGPWVVCTGCFRNWVREGVYCWDCGYDCWLFLDDWFSVGFSLIWAFGALEFRVCVSRDKVSKNFSAIVISIYNLHGSPYFYMHEKVSICMLSLGSTARVSACKPFPISLLPPTNANRRPRIPHDYLG